MIFVYFNLSNNNLRLSKINLAQLLLITDYEKFDILTEDLDVPFSQIMEEGPKKIFEKALSFRNDIKLAIANVEIAEADIKLAIPGFDLVDHSHTIKGSGSAQTLTNTNVQSLAKGGLYDAALYLNNSAKLVAVSIF